ncbi:heavy metal translocating P-type ATPase [Ophiocordyceps camponoti-floridani]|uniref:Heavy metal translocating P-type ATPase n=1 Tax=Ophiocordyceps camponoti-floridani TaxID=2030778 RepID=A0A8H4VDS3_9HYPO|nr:heavy metal translocating P-type ATPase [Ophiocordyceps camponoti-floridani]
MRTDVEKAQGIEHMNLSVDGMTCSGCGIKMERVLKGLAGVSAVRVNFVMASAEFSLDTSVCSPEAIVCAAERESGFRCLRLSADDQTLDLLSTGSSAKALITAAATMDGVREAIIISRKVVRVTYDPAIIGARILMRQMGSYSTGLAPPVDDPSLSVGRTRLRNGLIKTTISACCTLPVAVMAFSAKGLVEERTKMLTSVTLATTVQLIAVPVFYMPAMRTLVHRRSLDMNMLVATSITAAYVYSVVAMAFFLAGRALEVGPIFETSTLLVTLVLLGRLVAAYGRLRAVAAVSFRSLQASRAVIVENGKEREMDARLLQYGDELKIEAHAPIPTDAVVLAGRSEVDESIITGESLPVFKGPGDGIVAGSINGTGTLNARLRRLPGRNTVTDIARLVEEAANSRPRIQDMADRVASCFMPVVSGIAMIVIVAWTVVGIRIRGYGTGRAVANAMTYAVATLAVSCPCALGIAVPLVLVVAGGVAARNGVIIKSGECTERARKVTDVVLDKTGTMTEAALDVTDEKLFTAEDDEAIAISRALVADSKHPVSLAVARHLQDRRQHPIKLKDRLDLPGSGLRALVGDSAVVVRAGSAAWTGTERHPAVTELLHRGLTLLVVTRDGELLAVFGMRTKLRPETAAVVGHLRRRGIVVHVVSGDHKAAVDAAAAEVGIDGHDVTLVASKCSPADKRQYVARLMAKGRCVMFVGDGTNDAVAVTQADVGVQLTSFDSSSSASSGSHVTRAAADVVLLNGLDGIRVLLRISAVSFRRIIFNFVWSAAYNVLAVLLASGALVAVRIPPGLAGLGEFVSVLPVILAAASMLWKGIPAYGS